MHFQQADLELMNIAGSFIFYIFYFANHDRRALKTNRQCEIVAHLPLCLKGACCVALERVISGTKTRVRNDTRLGFVFGWMPITEGAETLSLVAWGGEEWVGNVHRHRRVCESTIVCCSTSSLARNRGQTVEDRL